MEKINLCGLTADEIFGIIRNEGFGLRHAVLISNLIYKKRTTDFSRSGRISKKLLELLREKTDSIINNPVTAQASADKSVKYLFRNDSGQYFETVYIPDGKRNTVCVSTQSGCRMGCPFCMTSKYGFHGNLTTGDILNQILGIPVSEKINHVVFMGMGEPLDNPEAVMKACDILTSEWGMALSSRNITVSTVGILSEVKQFLDVTSCNLTLSLFSPFTEERLGAIPAEKHNPVADIIEIMKNYPVKKKRRLSIAYVMISGVNDTDRHLNALTGMLRDSGIRVNLLPYHPVKNDNKLSSDEARMLFFKHNLVISGVSASVRKSRGADISAACGLLASDLSAG